MSSTSTLASPPAGENERYGANWFSVDQFWHQGLLVDELDFVAEYGVINGFKIPDFTQELSKAFQRT
ncbi:hypothetical protein CEP53_004229 [Fusarium sp. AF-6]|nr:hypothetical protein CEP53_004229 [Fusarium sp. AF-6]